MTDAARLTRDAAGYVLAAGAAAPAPVLHQWDRHPELDRWVRNEFRLP